MKRYPYLRCSGDRNRICLLCDALYMVKHPEEKDSFCPSCFTPVRKHEFRRIDSHLRHAKLVGLEATLTITQWLTILDFFHWQCAYCQKREFQVIEHIVSASNGGGTTALNCVPACARCNANKDNRSVKLQIVTLADIARVKDSLVKASQLQLTAS